ncbi:MAG TPA: HAD-IC family P-type ATPase [Thermoanaerobaculia bacterium]|nr:HAD-IC family P-type ATPase [Thermoanaerobaculia bacterium]
MEEVSRLLEVDLAHGVADDDVPRRRARFGANRLPEPQRKSLLVLFAAEFKSIIVALLGTAAIISLATGDRIDAAVILVVLLLNAVIGFITEWQAGRALEALRAQTTVTARIRRGDRVLPVPAEDLVAGDVVLLAAGDRVPADMRLMEASSLTTNESALTGESSTVRKDIDPVEHKAPVADRKSMAFLGTSVAAGRGIGLVTAVGDKTEIGKIGRLVSEVQEDVTPLQRRLDILGRRLVWIVLVVAAIVIVAGVLRGEKIWMMTEVGITLAVAAVPEALPAVTTFILAFGVLRMARRNAIVRRLSAVETLGSTTVICSDKTGTLTMNRMTVTTLQVADGRSIAIGAVPKIDHDLENAVDIMALCNDATGGHSSTGDPTEVALIDAAARLGFDVDEIRREFPRVAEFPFDAATKRMITVHRHNDEYLWLMKGAPGVVLESCPNVDAPAIERANQQLALTGLRVLALAMKSTRSQDEPPLSGYRFAGLVGMHDPPRPGALESIALARGAGIRVVMLTGDQVDTARAIARELHITDGEPRVMHANDVADLASAVESVDAFARVSPEDKYKIVTALQSQGEIVAVTGDGVNDAPALKKADVGVAMGERGTEVAKEAADIVLADDEFSTIVAAIEGGRTIYSNIGKFVHMMLSHNLAEIITIFIPIAIGWPLPLLPLQVLWLNLVTDVFPAFGLALEPAAHDTMTMPPRREDTLLTPALFRTIIWQSSILAIVALVSYRWALEVYGEGAHARTIALFALVGGQIGQTFNCRSLRRSAFNGLSRNPYLWIAVGAVFVLQLASVHVAGLRKILGAVVLARADWIVFAVAIIVPIVVVEVVKAIRRLASPLHA